jgi:hypothetical protein
LLGPAIAAGLCLVAATVSYGATSAPIYHYAVSAEYSETTVYRTCPSPENPAPPPYTVAVSGSGRGEGYISSALGGLASFRGSMISAVTTSDGVSNTMTFDDVFVATVTTTPVSRLDPTHSAPWTVHVLGPFPHQTVSASFGSSFGVSVHHEEVGGPLFPCGLAAYTSTATGTATFSLLETLVFSDSDGRTRPPSNSRPRADAGGPYKVRRGARLRLDGSRSRARSGNASYRWTFGTRAPHVAAVEQNCRPRHSAAKRGARPKVVVLCDIKSKLTVTDRHGRSDTDTTTIHVRPRKWDPVKFVQRPGVKRLRGSFVYEHGACLTCEWGRDIDTRDVDSDDQSSGYIIRGGRKDEHGFTVDQVDNPNGPFDEDWYVADHELRIDRTALVNGRLFPGGEVYELAAKANKALVQSGRKPLYSVDAVRQSTTDHEHLHARLIGEALRALPDEKDPVKQLERLTRRSRSQLEKDGDVVIGAAATILKDATADVHVKARMPAKWRRGALLLLPEGKESFASFAIPSLADLGDSG